MKNITLSIEEDVLQEARKIAAERGTTVHAIVRASLAELVRQKKAHARRAEARARARGGGRHGAL